MTETMSENPEPIVEAPPSPESESKAKGKGERAGSKRLRPHRLHPMYAVMLANQLHLVDLMKAYGTHQLTPGALDLLASCRKPDSPPEPEPTHSLETEGSGALALSSSVASPSEAQAAATTPRASMTPPSSQGASR
jgi:hypothetical protein